MSKFTIDKSHFITGEILRPRKEDHKKEPLAWSIIKAVARILAEFGAIASGIEYLLRIIKLLGRF